MRKALPAAVALLCVAILSCSEGSGERDTLRLAVLTFPVDPSVPDSPMVMEDSITWAAEVVNETGLLPGINLEPAYFNLMTAERGAAGAKRFGDEILEDADIAAATGIFSFVMAPAFIRSKVPFISSVSTTADLFRAFKGTGYIWRTVESDTVQSWLLLAEARKIGREMGKDNVGVALLTSMQQYGTTFFDWFGFQASELGLTPKGVVRFKQVEAFDEYMGDERPPEEKPILEICESWVEEALKDSPDVLIVVPERPHVAVCAVKVVKAKSADTRVLLSDSAYTPLLISMLGEDAEGLSGFVPAPDPDSGFAEAFKERTGGEPTAYAANSFDAVLLAAYGLAYSRGKPGAALDEGIRAAVDGRGEKIPWSTEGVAKTIEAILDGEKPDIEGATGPLTFDKEFYTDPVNTFYARWEVEAGAFKTTGYVTTADEGSEAAESQTSMARALASENRRQSLESGEAHALPELGDSWALIVASSATWPNYRHQSDALAHYQLLKKNGFTDERIILVVADDIAANEANPEQGLVVNVKEGPNVYETIQIDYKLSDIGAGSVFDILGGKKSDTLPTVIESDADDNVYVFIVGHGGHQGVFLLANEAVYELSEEENILTPKRLADTIETMDEEDRYRRVFIAVEACHSGVLGPELEAREVKDVVLFTAANGVENSLAANYVPDIGVWAADQFSYAMLEAYREDPDLSVAKLYERVYGEVSGSHVSVFNAGGLGDVHAVKVREFIFPK